jgi:hypothetical protein
MAAHGQAGCLAGGAASARAFLGAIIYAACVNVRPRLTSITFSLATTTTSRTCRAFARSVTQSRARARAEEHQRRGAVLPGARTNTPRPAVKQACKHNEVIKGLKMVLRAPLAGHPAGTVLDHDEKGARLADRRRARPGRRRRARA